MNAQSRPKAPSADALQSDLFVEGAPGPAGFRYQPDIIDAGEEFELAQRLDALPFQPFDFHGHLANRQVISFGLRHDYGRREVIEAPPIPDWLAPLRDKVGAFAGRPADAFVQVLINEYRPGAGIGWHKDKPHFDHVVGVSLLSPCTFRFRHRRDETWERQSLTVEPRSAYLLSGAARHSWEHSLPPMDRHRYSITFRTLAAQR